jgi:hypothetical protein
VDSADTSPEMRRPKARNVATKLRGRCLGIDRTILKRACVDLRGLPQRKTPPKQGASGAWPCDR